MSFFKSHLSHLKPNQQPEYETTEMTQIADIDSFMSLMDGRNSLSNILPEDDNNDDNSSLSSLSTNSIDANNGVKYNYNEDDEEEEEEDDHFLGDEAEQSLVSNGRSNMNDLESGTSGLKKKRGGKKLICVGFLLLLLVIWIIWTIGLSRVDPDVETEEKETANHIDLPDLYNSSFFVKQPTLVWLENDPRDGIFTYSDPTTRDILRESVEDGKTEIFVKLSDLNIRGEFLQVDSFEISQDAQYLFLKTNVTKQWRYSTFSNVYIYKFADKTMWPLDIGTTIDDVPAVKYITWSPTGHKLAYVLGNEIYVTDLQTTTRVTFDGSETILNGVPDWVYEEEVFETDSALWWSPDSTHLAYLRFNETDVPEFHLQYYTASDNAYPDEVSIKYPKAGAPNPLISLHVYSLDSNTTATVTSTLGLKANIKTSKSYVELNETDRLITDVIWATNTSTHILFKQTNRIQDLEITSLVTIGKSPNETTIENVRTYQPEDGGWVDSLQTLVYIPSSNNTVNYLDIIDDGEGYMHLAILSTKDTANPTWLTSGAWEVIPGTVVVDHDRNLIHYVSTERSHLERHLYKLDLNQDALKTCLTCPEDPEQHGYYSATFSPKKGYYILQYDGPDVPTTVVKKVDNETFETVLQDNSALKRVLSTYELPRTRIVPVKSGGVDMEAMEVLPPDFDATKKYPVLFHVYGGPGSQLASYRYDLSWSTFLASKLGYIVVTVDGRGTGYKGRKYRSGVRGRLGELETIDQINAARHWSELEYVDPSRIAIWGWSYGGYMVSKVIEANSGVFAAGLAVAPVTDWRYYDSIYTERYMMTPQLNPDGYASSAVSNMTGFDNAKFLLIHGTGDDNVHFQHSAVLVDKLTQANVHNYQVQYFTDNNHAIQYHNGNENVFYLLTDFLWESFGGEEYLHVRKELNGHFSGPLSPVH